MGTPQTFGDRTDCVRRSRRGADSMMGMGKLVYGFSEGSGEMKDLLGGKGAGLAVMSRLGLPVPPGFTITAEACRAYMETGSLPGGLMEAVAEHLRDLEEATCKRSAATENPLLVSVRSGAAV